jgi:ATP-binding cassette, subfamily B, multidrug efflux pump
VLQETTLFSGTIRENIAFGKPDASRRRSKLPPKPPQAHDFIMSFPDGYNTHVGERGKPSPADRSSASPLPAPCSSTRAS